MELILNSKFEYLNENELENIDGGVGVAVLYLTGKAALPYVAAGVKFAASAIIGGYIYDWWKS